MRTLNSFVGKYMSINVTLGDLFLAELDYPITKITILCYDPPTKSILYKLNFVMHVVFHLIYPLYVVLL